MLHLFKTASTLWALIAVTFILSGCGGGGALEKAVAVDMETRANERYKVVSVEIKEHLKKELSDKTVHDVTVTTSVAPFVPLFIKGKEIEGVSILRSIIDPQKKSLSLKGELKIEEREGQYTVKDAIYDNTLIGLLHAGKPREEFPANAILETDSKAIAALEAKKEERLKALKLKQEADAKKLKVIQDSNKTYRGVSRSGGYNFFYRMRFEEGGKAVYTTEKTRFSASKSYYGKTKIEKGKLIVDVEGFTYRFTLNEFTKALDGTVYNQMAGAVTGQVTVDLEQVVN